jgi:hypothetical protein
MILHPGYHPLEMGLPTRLYFNSRRECTSVSNANYTFSSVDQIIPVEMKDLFMTATSDVLSFSKKNIKIKGE